MLILASKSPRRRELLEAAGFVFLTEAPDGEEIIPAGASPEKAVRALSLSKAREISQKHPRDVVIGADTIVVCNGAILGKPVDRDDAFRMLKMLSGRTHAVYTGVAVIGGKNREKVFFKRTKVRFFGLSDGEINAYIDTGEPFDKAGAYGIQGAGMLLVAGISGDFYNVMGLPIASAARILREFL